LNFNASYWLVVRDFCRRQVQDVGYPHHRRLILVTNATERAGFRNISQDRAAAFSAILTENAHHIRLIMLHALCSFVFLEFSGQRIGFADARRGVADVAALGHLAAGEYKDCR
jgi:hypothetical protein